MLSAARFPLLHRVTQYTRSGPPLRKSVSRGTWNRLVGRALIRLACEATGSEYGTGAFHHPAYRSSRR